MVAGVNTDDAPGHRVLLSPHPGAVLLAHLLHALRELEPSEAVATLVQPASMRDEPGIEELFEQTRQIVAMTRRQPTPVFGAQLSFNLLPTPLPADPVAAQLGAVLAGSPPLSAVALQILQGAVFHSVSASLYVRCGGDPGVQAIRKALAGHVSSRSGRQAPPPRTDRRRRQRQGLLRQRPQGRGRRRLLALGGDGQPHPRRRPERDRNRGGGLLKV